MTGQNKKITFEGTQGYLAARLDSPAGKPRAYALFAHCFTCSKDIFAASRIAGALAERGIAVLRFDFTGLGASDGEFANTNFSSNIGDLLKAADYLRSEYVAPALLIGHSLGGAAVLAAAGEIPETRCVATIGAPYDPEHVKDNFRFKIDEIEEHGEAEVELAGRPFRIQKQFLEDLAIHNQEKRIGALRRALMVLHAPRDEVVGIDNAADIYTAARHPKSFVALDGADHLLTRRSDAEYAAEIIAAWAGRYLDGETDHAPRTSMQVGPGQTIVAESGSGKFAQNIVSGGHHLLADEPVDFGGDDTGPGPYDLLLSALGACTTMTIRMYADHKKLALEHVAVRLDHKKIHAEDCADCETKGGKIDLIEREVELVGDLSKQERGRLMEIADKCPVHRTLHAEVKVSTREAGA